LKQRVFPVLKTKKPLFLIVIDNLRLDQWEDLEYLLTPYFNVEQKDTYFSILPTTTAFARNSLFSGMMPSDMARLYPNLWEDEDSDEGKNNFEEDWIKINLAKNKLNYKFTYNKIIQTNQGKAVLDQFHTFLQNDLNVLVYNFVDMVSHA